MSKAVMINIKPQLCQHITQGKEIIEARMTKPKLKTPFKCFIYENKNFYRESGGCLFQGSGEVIGEFVCDYIEKYSSLQGKFLYDWHISDLVIYDKPKSLYEFSKHDNTYNNAFGWVFDDRPKNIQLTRPHYPWSYVEEKE